LRALVRRLSGSKTVISGPFRARLNSFPYFHVHDFHVPGRGGQFTSVRDVRLLVAMPRPTVLRARHGLLVLFAVGFVRCLAAMVMGQQMSNHDLCFPSHSFECNATTLLRMRSNRALDTSISTVIPV
jgi:hypothetical protein